MSYLDLDYIKANADEMNWDSFCRYSDFSKIDDSFFERFEEDLKWDVLTRLQYLKEEFIDKFSEKILNWYPIVRNNKLSESLIEKYKDVVPWIEIFAFQELSNEFVLRNKHRVNWGRVFSWNEPTSDGMSNAAKKYPEFNTKKNELFKSKLHKISRR